MKKPLFSSLALAASLLASYAGQAQAIDPSFLPTTLYTPAGVTAAVPQPDGKRVLLGSFARPQTKTTVRLMRYNADNTIDEAFVANTASLRGIMYNVRVLPSGKLLLIGDGALTLNGLTREDLLLLNADGTADASFNAGSASGGGLARVSAVQPDGRILIGGSFTTYNGVAAQRIVRLLATGAVDPAFTGAPLNDIVEDITLQSNGSILVGGRFDSPAGVARLLPNGTLDPTFSSPLTTSARVSMVGLQPNGNILLGSGSSSLPFVTSPSSFLARLLPSGIRDASFDGNGATAAALTNQNDGNEFIVQPNGQIILPVQGSYSGSPTNSLIRLNADGTRDVSFSQGLSGINSGASVISLQQEANGKLLMAGARFALGTRRNNVVVLNADGTLDASFNPVLLTNGTVNSTVLQADGKILIGGPFDEANGVRVNNLARLNADGTVDASFSTQSANQFIPMKLAVQPDGNILLSGTQALTGTSVAQQLIRLLPSGANDNTFQVAPNTAVVLFGLQPNGGIIIANGYQVKRLLATGQPDNTFTAGEVDGAIYGMHVQPDNKVLVGGYWDNYNNTPLIGMVRLLPNGALDPAFSSPMQSVPGAEADEFLVQPDGKIIVAGFAAADNPATMPYVLFRMLPNGATDNTFSATLPVFNGYSFARGIALQPNGRVLAATYGGPVVRVLANGQPDASFTPVILNTDAEDVLVQTDGKILLGGYFNTVNGVAMTGLARLTAPNVLHVANTQLEARTQAWPVPAHTTLNLSLDASARPQSVQLFDNLGRTVLTQPATQATLTMPLQQVKAGVYLLRVNYAEGPVTRRVVVE